MGFLQALTVNEINHVTTAADLGMQLLFVAELEREDDRFIITAKRSVLCLS